MPGFPGGVHISQLETPTEYRRLWSVTTACIKNHLWAGLTCHAAVMIYMERNSNRQMERKTGVKNEVLGISGMSCWVQWMPTQTSSVP